jgi:hypothetical protein
MSDPVGNEANSAAAGPAATKSEATAPAPESGVATDLVRLGIIVGLALVVVGIALLSFGRTPLIASLMTCGGLGIVLASFGSKAGGSWAGWSVTGSCAMTIALFMLLQYYQPVPVPVHFKKGQLRLDFSKVADLRIVDEQPMYEYRDRTTSSIRFVLLEKKLKSNRLSIQVDTTEKGDGKEFFEIIGDAQAIQTRYLSDDTDSDKQIQWAFDYAQRVVKDGPDVIFKEQDSLQGLLPAQKSGMLDWPPALGISTALAQDATVRPNPAVVNDLISKLKSDDTTVRRNARDDLSALGPPAVETMMASLKSSGDNYRVRLGVMYALQDMLRRNPDQRAAVSKALKSDDFPVLVAAASDDDKTIRLQAAGFLYLLQDPRVVPSSVEAARKTSDDNKATDQVLIIRQAGQSLGDTEKKSVINDLTSGPGLSNDLVGSAGFVRKTLGW